MIPPMTALAATPAAPARLRRLGFVYMPMGCDVTRWTPPGERHGSTSCRPSSSPLAPVKEHVTVVTNLELRNAYPGTHATSNSAFLSAARAKLHREHRLLPRHDRRPDRRPADRPGDAAAVAGAVDGPAVDSSASATTATPASTRTTCRGRRRRRRCRPRPTRGSSSSASSATAAPRPTAAPPCGAGPACSTP